MEKNNSVYITTTLPYVNADPHVGFAMEIIRADALVRYLRLCGKNVFFNTGTDEHGAKIYENALNAGLNPQTYVDGYAAKFKELTHALNIDDIHFIRTTDDVHVKAAEEMWKRCFAKGDIYKKIYKTKYCIGCELEKTESELVEGKCPIHPNRDIEIREEENYFFRWSKYQKRLLAYYDEHADFVIPNFRFNETRSFVERGLEDFSISRLKSKMPWGVPVPGDDDHVMYVWFDALTSYISTLGWPDNTEQFERFWKNGSPIQFCGKDNNRQQSAMWQAMLMSADLPSTAHVVIDGFITSGGQKMSKSIGNVISPFDVIEYFKPYTQFPEDVLRFVLLHDIPSFEDGDLTMESIRASYVAHLQNGIGNLTSRIMKMAITHFDEPIDMTDLNKTFEVTNFDLKKSIEGAWSEVTSLDAYIQSTEPFKLVKKDLSAGKEVIKNCVAFLFDISQLLRPFLPHTSTEILRLIREHKMPETPLFNRLPE